MKKSFTFSCLFLFISFTSFAQLKIGAPAGAPAASAILDISNTGAATNAKKGFLGPQVALSGTDDATTVPTPVAGLMVYNTNTSAAGATAVVAGYYYYNGTQWVQMVSSAAPASGNIYTANGTLTSARTVTMGGNTLGFVGNNVGIGTASPTYPLHIVGQSLGVDNTAAGTASFAELKSGPVATPTTLRLQSNVGSSFVGNLTNHDFQIFTNNIARIITTAAGDVGIGTTTPNSTLQVVGSIASAFTATTANLTLTGAHSVVQNTSQAAGTVTITVPTPVGIAGRQYVIMAPTLGGPSLTTVASPVGQLQGASIRYQPASTPSNTVSINLFPGQKMTLISDGANWQILNFDKAINVYVNLNGAPTGTFALYDYNALKAAGVTGSLEIRAGFCGDGTGLTYTNIQINFGNSVIANTTAQAIIANGTISIPAAASSTFTRADGCRSLSFSLNNTTGILSFTNPANGVNDITLKITPVQQNY